MWLNLGKINIRAVLLDRVNFIKRINVDKPTINFILNVQFPRNLGEVLIMDYRLI